MIVLYLDNQFYKYVPIRSCAAVPLSEDHKPNRIDERKRIESAGGVIMWAGRFP